LHRDATSRGARYELHELVRQYAAEQLDRSPDAVNAVRDRHADHYCDALARWAVDLRSERLPAALAEMDAEIENARAAWDWAAERGLVVHLDRAMEGLGQFYEIRCRYQGGIAAFRKASERLTDIRERQVEAGRPRPRHLVTRVLIRTLVWQSSFHQTVQQRELNRQCVERAWVLLEGPDLRRQDVRREKALILRERGWSEWPGPDPDHVFRLQAQSLALFREIGDPWQVGEGLCTLGEMYNVLGQYNQGRQAIEESIAIYQGLGAPIGTARGTWFLALTHVRQGRSELAEPLARESLSIYRELGHRFSIAQALVVLSLALLYTGSYRQAQSSMNECLSIGDDLGVHRSWLFTILGETKLHLGHYERARSLATEGLALAQEETDRPAIITALNVLGQAMLVRGARAEAKQRLDECLALCEDEITQSYAGITHAYRGYVSREEGTIAQAWYHVRQALQIGAALGDPRPRTRALPLCALLFADRGEVARAVELYALASRHPHVAHSRWFEDVVGKQVAAAAAALPPDIVAAAQERGRARDLEATVEELLAELGA
jgi:tetratricopeptide (TPR) repeat protein